MWIGEVYLIPYKDAYEPSLKFWILKKDLMKIKILNTLSQETNP